MKRLGAVGDVHGDIDRLKKVLLEDSYVDENYNCCAKNSTLVFIGDLTDRGPNGIAVIKYVMQLEKQAEEAGGKVVSLLGNHDVMLVARAMCYRTKSEIDLEIKYWFTINGGYEEEAEELHNNPAMFE